MELISWPSTPLLRQALCSIEYRSTFIGKDSEDNALFDKTKQLPTLTYRATVKIHGMNCSVAFDTKEKTVNAQSRTLILSETETCNGFYNFVFEQEIKDFFWYLVNAVDEHVAQKYSRYAIFGEWAGQSIQKKVAVCKAPKFFTIFGVVGLDEEGNKHQIDDDIVYLLINSKKSKPKSIYHSLNFPSFIFTLNFNEVSKWLPELSKIVEEIEKNCPVGAYFGEQGTGEGLVFKCLDPDWQDPRYWFKLKGEKHKVSKEKTVDEAKVQIQESVQEFVDYACTENRLEQGISLIFEQRDKTPNKDQIADFLRWVVQDILKEEQDTLEESGITSKDVTKAISAKARNWFLAKY